MYICEKNNINGDDLHQESFPSRQTRSLSVKFYQAVDAKKYLDELKKVEDFEYQELFPHLSTGGLCNLFLVTMPADRYEHLQALLKSNPDVNYAMEPAPRNMF